ncbi:MAG: GNAT family N-acetyltransferase [Caulobacteraceae bacterium]
MGEHPQRPTLKTKRLALRGLRPHDAPRMAELVDDYDIARMTTRIPHPFAVEHAEDFIARMQGRDPARETVFAIETKAEGLLGVLGLHPTPAGIELGCWLGRPFWGLGYATEAALAALAWAGADWGRRYIVSGHFADNPASGRVLTKVGFLYTGEVVGRFSLARGEEAATRMMVWLA